MSGFEVKRSFVWLGVWGKLRNRVYIVLRSVKEGVI